MEGNSALMLEAIKLAVMVLAKVPTEDGRKLRINIQRHPASQSEDILFLWYGKDAYTIVGAMTRMEGQSVRIDHDEIAEMAAQLALVKDN